MRSTSVVQGVPKVLFCILITYMFLVGHLESEQFIQGAETVSLGCSRDFLRWTRSQRSCKPRLRSSPSATGLVLLMWALLGKSLLLEDLCPSAVDARSIVRRQMSSGLHLSVF